MITPQLRASRSLHESVRQETLNRIKNGTYLPNIPIPSTATLSREFGVSPITIKRALRDLQAIGAVTAIAGKGTFVKEQRRSLIDLSDGIACWETANIRLISIAKEKISDPAMEMFNPPGDAMLCVRKMIFFAGEPPLAYDFTYLSPDVDDATIDKFGTRPVTEALGRHGIRIRNISYLIDASTAARQVAKAFAIPNGYPMLRRLYKITTTKKGLTIFGILQAPFDRLSYSLNIQSDTKLRPKPKHASGAPRQKGVIAR
ncbi:GntR family transcriptional regulator [Bradyrhizobium centrolobii]|uniref:GntR family transcriptional regulator n=1 Tax=Bradyrhizobium centrolobii TaxID=1505087 RepID=UPI000AE26313|nr:GntR family transcriptional regulator [Bradyrhizobium centrolobii]